MAINKVVYDGNTIVDLTSDTVSPESLLNGVTAHDKSGASIMGVMTDLPYHIYAGSIVKTVSASREITVFSNAETRSNFNVISGKENEIFLSIVNGDYGAQSHRVTSVSYRSNSGWNMYLDGNASAGAFRINYCAIVPDAYSSI